MSGRDARAGRGLLQRVDGIHRADCEALALRAAAPMGAAEDAPPTLEPGGAREERYLVESRRAFEAMRRLIGQASGLLILAAQGAGRAAVELPEVEQAAERAAELEDLVRAGAAAPGWEAHHAARLRAASLIRAALDAMRTAPANRAAEAADEAAARLSAAYRLLHALADARAGMSVIDFSRACCTCGTSHNRGRA